MNAGVLQPTEVKAMCGTSDQHVFMCLDKFHTKNKAVAEQRHFHSISRAYRYQGSKRSMAGTTALQQYTRHLLPSPRKYGPPPSLRALSTLSAACSKAGDLSPELVSHRNLVVAFESVSGQERRHREPGRQVKTR